MDSLEHLKFIRCLYFAFISQLRLSDNSGLEFTHLWYSKSKELSGYIRPKVSFSCK